MILTPAIYLGPSKHHRRQCRQIHTSEWWGIFDITIAMCMKVWMRREILKI